MRKKPQLILSMQTKEIIIYFIFFIKEIVLKKRNKKNYLIKEELEDIIFTKKNQYPVFYCLTLK